jgi:GNAT superfamily N-acetyltransferase
VILKQPLDLANGYYKLPKGKLANVVTCLEMTAKTPLRSAAMPANCKLRRVDPDDLDAYRTIFKRVGEDLMWFSRLIMPDEKLRGILVHADVESYVLYRDEKAVGLLELDFKDMPNCELSFFGLAREAVGSGLGSVLMNEAISRAWSRPITRFWVHTCHFDHPNALGFYRRSGFTPYALMIEVHDDPRLQGKLPREASPHVALLDP